MWNVLIVIIIAAAIWIANPFKGFDLKPTAGVDKKTQTEVNSVVNEATQQVSQARQLQQEEQNNSNNN